jgi:hypothetical protein
MRAPGFTAEAGVYRSGNFYRVHATASGRNLAVEAALSVGGLSVTCSGNCPDGQLLCQCDKKCGCCIHGCGCDVNGNVICDTNPTRGGGLSAGFAGSELSL